MTSFCYIEHMRMMKSVASPAIKSLLTTLILLPVLYLVGFLLIPSKLTIGWHGLNWCSTDRYHPEQIQQYLIFQGFWMGLALAIFVLIVFLSSYHYGRSLQRKTRLLLAISFCSAFLFIGVLIANTSNISLIKTINDSNACRD